MIEFTFIYLIVYFLSLAGWGIFYIMRRFGSREDKKEKDTLMSFEKACADMCKKLKGTKRI